MENRADLDAATERLRNHLQALKDVAEGDDVAALLEAFLKEVADMHRMFDRVEWDLELRELAPVDSFRTTIHEAAETTIEAVTTRFGLESLTADQVRAYATKEGPFLWKDQGERLTAFQQRAAEIQKAATSRLQDASQRLIAVAAEHEEGQVIEQGRFEAAMQPAIAALHDVLARCDRLIEDMDDDTDLLGHPITADLRSRIVELREGTAKGISEVPGESVGRRWPRPSD